MDNCIHTNISMQQSGNKKCNKTHVWHKLTFLIKVLITTHYCKDIYMRQSC